ncbi:MAG: hypothetical protein KDD45_16545 [Bdellovibrionales bacterium]|nr:hypothetical protein [Bdellovibrionales bacterium]
MRALEVFATLIFFVFLGMANNSFADQGQSREVIVGIQDAFIPGGFDIYSDTYVIASGIFPNGCYRWSHADINNVDQFTHEIRSIATVQSGMCIMALIPFNKEIKLGKFNAGEHTIRFVNGDGTYFEKMMMVEQ